MRFNVIPNGHRFAVMDRRTGQWVGRSLAYRWEAETLADTLNTEGPARTAAFAEHKLEA